MKTTGESLVLLHWITLIPTIPMIQIPSRITRVSPEEEWSTVVSLDLYGTTSRMARKFTTIGQALTNPWKISELVFA
jgi:hypothetical protein